MVVRHQSQSYEAIQGGGEGCGFEVPRQIFRNEPGRFGTIAKQMLFNPRKKLEFMKHGLKRKGIQNASLQKETAFFGVVLSELQERLFYLQNQKNQHMVSFPISIGLKNRTMQVFGGPVLRRLPPSVEEMDGMMHQVSPSQPTVLPLQVGNEMVPLQDLRVARQVSPVMQRGYDLRQYVAGQNSCLDKPTWYVAKDDMLDGQPEISEQNKNDKCNSIGTEKRKEISMRHIPGLQRSRIEEIVETWRKGSEASNSVPIRLMLDPDNRRDYIHKYSFELWEKDGEKYRFQRMKDLITIVAEELAEELNISVVGNDEMWNKAILQFKNKWKKGTKQVPLSNVIKMWKLQKKQNATANM